MRKQIASKGKSFLRQAKRTCLRLGAGVLDLAFLFPIAAANSVLSIVDHLYGPISSDHAMPAHTSTRDRLWSRGCWLVSSMVGSLTIGCFSYVACQFPQMGLLAKCLLIAAGLFLAFVTFTLAVLGYQIGQPPREWDDTTLVRASDPERLQWLVRTASRPNASL